MTRYDYLQNIVLLLVAGGLSAYLRSGWPFLLMLFFTYQDSPKPKDPLSNFELPKVNFLFGRKTKEK
jgi:hypothetical protein